MGAQKPTALRKVWTVRLERPRSGGMAHHSRWQGQGETAGRRGESTPRERT
jgi:hypothetical protein